MTANKFEGMTAEKVADTIFHGATDTAKVDAAFEDLKSLDAAVRNEAVDVLEKKAIRDTRTMAKEFKLLWGMVEGMEALFGDLLSAEEKEEAAREEERDLNAAQSICQIFFHVAEVKGDTAQPLTKAVVQKVSTLSDEEYNTIKTLYAEVTKVCEGVPAEESAKVVPKKPNPLRPKPPGL